MGLRHLQSRKLVVKHSVKTLLYLVRVVCHSCRIDTVVYLQIGPNSPEAEEQESTQKTGLFEAGKTEKRRKTDHS
jgi:hypothetical protein